MKADSTETSAAAPSEQKPTLTCGVDGNEENRSTPQKLNRKQRRKLQQMQNAEQTKQATPSTTSATPDIAPATTTKELPLKNGDGLLPTPPPSLRLLLNDTADNQPNDNPPTRPVASKLPVAENVPSSQKTVSRLTQPSLDFHPSKQDTAPAALVHAPIGSSRPLVPAPIQPPTSMQLPNIKNSQLVTSTCKDTVEQMNGTTLQPPVNPVLLAQMQLQKFGIDAALPVNPPSSFSAGSVPSQTVTNTMIQRYLEQIAQAPEVETTSTSVSASIHLSELLQQPPVPASSLSEGPQKSKLLQWTQTNSANNSEPTTPPDERAVATGQKIDPVSAKWGVIAAPRLSPTPAEFKPGVPWRPRGEPGEVKDNSEYDAAANKVSKLISKTELSKLSSPLISQQPTIATNRQVTSSATSESIIQDSLVVRPPPGLNAASSEMKKRGSNACWLVLKGLTGVSKNITFYSPRNLELTFQNSDLFYHHGGLFHGHDFLR